jgi:heme/copper-type cytochrome/quinol oxidase subunit 1
MIKFYKFLLRWFCSTNAKDIGVLYLIFAFISALIGTSFSMLIRLELTSPGVQYIESDKYAQIYNNLITAHAVFMIFMFVMPALIGAFGNILPNLFFTICIKYLKVFNFIIFIGSKFNLKMKNYL